LSGAFLHVSFGPAAWRCAIEQVALDLGGNIWSLVFHTNSHLLVNGEHRLTVTLDWSDGLTLELDTKLFRVENVGELARQVSQELIAAATPVLFGRTVDSTLFPYTRSCTAWFDRPDSQRDVPLSLDPLGNAEAARAHLSRWGYAILPNVVPREIVDGLNREVDEAIANGSLIHRQGSSDRILNTHKLPHGRRVWLYPPVIEFLRTWFRDEPCACQTLYFMNGSEQHAHQDTIHLTPYPAGYMCGVWVALEDVQASSGELFVYPGSHRSNRLLAGPLGLQKVVADDYSAYTKFDAEVSRIIAQNQFQRSVYRPKTGQILVWHENLIHGGSARGDPGITRRSIVSHYFARGSVAYYDSRGEAATLEALPS
jgi:ectoine hydroxylase-related dioxygenase (phytanoyl-CoA dioxygenase family)